MGTCLKASHRSKHSWPPTRVVQPRRRLIFLYRISRYVCPSACYLCDILLQVLHPVPFKEHPWHLHAVGAGELVVLDSASRIANLSSSERPTSVCTKTRRFGNGLYLPISPRPATCPGSTRSDQPRNVRSRKRGHFSPFPGAERRAGA